MCGMCGQWTCRGCGVRRARVLVRVVCHAEIEAQWRLNHKPPQWRGGMCLGVCDAPRGTWPVSSFMITLNVPRRLRWPNRAGSARTVNYNSIQPFVRARSTMPVARFQPGVFWQSGSERCVNRHPGMRRQLQPPFRGTCTVEHGRWQARLAIARR